jgi:hypothetical protein
MCDIMIFKIKIWFLSGRVELRSVKLHLQQRHMQKSMLPIKSGNALKNA